MRTLIVGGFGHFGLLAAERLSKDPEVSEIALADRNIDQSKLASKGLKSPKVISVNLDISNYAALVDTIKAYDVVVNMSAPYSRFGLPVMKAAIEARRNYVDLCEDVHVTRDAFSLDEEAHKAGISICIGCGSNPGISNVLIKYLADQLDTVEEIKMRIALGLGNGASMGIFQFFFETFMGSNIQFIDGKHNVPEDRGQEEVKFNEPYGRQTVYYAGWPQVITLPRTIKSVRNVTTKLALMPGWFNEWLLQCIDIGLGENEEMENHGHLIKPRDYISSILSKSHFMVDKSKNHKGASRLYTVKGIKNGKNTTLSHSFTISPVDGTVITACQVAKMLYEGRVEQKGVLAPESFIDAEEMINFWRNRGEQLEFLEN
jgi:lysine 6-dehydrogenase